MLEKLAMPIGGNRIEKKKKESQRRGVDYSVISGRRARLTLFSLFGCSTGAEPRLQGTGTRWRAP